MTNHEGGSQRGFFVDGGNDDDDHVMLNHEGRVTRQPPYSVVYEASTKQMPSSFYLHILFIIAITRMMIMMIMMRVAIVVTMEIMG